MRKWIFLLVIPLIIMSCGSKDKGYNELEKGLIGLLEEKEPEVIERHFLAAAKAGNEDIYGLAYQSYGKNGEVFFDQFLNKSKGEAEYYKGWLMKDREEPQAEVIKMFESAAKQGNNRAYYMLGMIFQNKLDFTKAQEYFKKGKDVGEIYSQSSYEYNKEFTSVYKRIEELNKKYKDNSITPEEKKEMGTLILEKFMDYEKAYEILKEFVAEEYSPALYTKAKLLTDESKADEAAQMYNKIFVKDKYFLASYEIANILATENKNYELALKVLEDTKSEEALIYGSKAFIYENLKKYDKAEENYLKAISKNKVEVALYLSLGSLYEEKKELQKAKDIYLKGYSLGSVEAGFKLAQVLEEIEQEKLAKQKTEIEIKQSKEARKILERLVVMGDSFSMVDLSNYYPEKDKNIKILNLRGAAKLNPTAFYNLGVHYYIKNDKEKSKFYLKIAKENGYELPIEFEAFISS